MGNILKTNTAQTYDARAHFNPMHLIAIPCLLSFVLLFVAQSGFGQVNADEKVKYKSVERDKEKAKVETEVETYPYAAQETQIILVDELLNEVKKTEQLTFEAVDVQKEHRLTNTTKQRGAITAEETEEMTYMQDANRERNMNDCFMQLETIEKQMQEIETKLKGVENSQMTGEVKKAKQGDWQMKKEDLLKTKHLLKEKLELLELQKKQNDN